MPDFEGLVASIAARIPAGMPAAARALAHNYGARYADVVACADGRAELLAPLEGSAVLGAAIMGRELGWDGARSAAEIAKVEAFFQHKGAIRAFGAAEAALA